MAVWDDVIDSIEEYVLNLVNSIVGSIDQRIDSVWDSIGTLWSQVGDTLDSALDSVDEKTTSLQSAVNSQIDSVLQTVERNTTGIITQVTTAVGDVLEAVEGVVPAIQGKLTQGIDSVLDRVGGAVSTLNDRITTGITTVIESVESSTSGLTQLITETTSSIGESLTTGMSAVGQAVGEPLAEVVKVLGTIGSAIPSGDTLSTLGGLVAQAKLALAEVLSVQPGPGSGIRRHLDDTSLQLVSMLAQVVGSPLGLLPVLGTYYGAGVGQLDAQDARRVYRPTRLGAPELSLLARRGTLEGEDWVSRMSDLGYPEEDIRHVFALSESLLSLGDYISLWRRGHITIDQLRESLTALGYEPESINRAISLSSVIPGIADLITMSVRDAFSPEVAARFGQYEEYPTDLTPYAEAQGLSQEWAQRYWASHWRLPSVEQGYEMLHRGIISPEDLQLLLKASDIMPFWREKLLNTSYSAFTRVDIRRMHKVGVLDRAMVVRAYQDIGYDPQKAELMTQFTERVNSEERDVEAQAERELTAAEVTSLYLEGFIDSSELEGLLVQLGYSPESAALKAGLATARLVKVGVGKRVELAKLRYLYSHEPLSSLQDELNRLQLSEYEIRAHLDDVQLTVRKAQLKMDKTPIRTEVDYPAEGE